MVGEEHLERCAEVIMRFQAFLLLCGFSLFVHAAPADMPTAQVNPELQLKLPEGFRMQVYASVPAAGADYFRGPRFMAFGPDGHLYLSLGLDNKVVMLPDRDRDGKADEVMAVADGLNAPQGLAFADGKLFVANQDGIVRLEQKDGSWPAAAVIPIVKNLPVGGHTLKSLRVGPDKHLYINVGSSCNVCDETDPLRATMLRYTQEGQPAGALVTVGRHAPSPIWARGLRNTQGFAWHPVTGALFATNNGSDMRSATKGGQPDDDLPPEHLNLLEAGQHYGWPYCWGNRFTDPNFPGPDGFCKETQPPVMTFPAHSTPIGITFLDRADVPAAYKGDALVALHGSWNRSVPSGYKLVRVHFEQGKPVSVSDFATGWLRGNEAWGRPVDVTVGPDGAIYVSDDRAGSIYRITYRGSEK
jgi:glucose/arabinose dehydrogenase